MKSEAISIFWYRRDLRLFDNKSLQYALKDDKPVLPLFIFDTDLILDLDKNDRRIAFIYNEISNIKKQLNLLGKDIIVEIGKPAEIFSKLTKLYNIAAVYSNKDHEPYGIKRDKEIELILSNQGIKFVQYLDHLIADKSLILKEDGKPYSIYTPYKNKFKQIISDADFKDYNIKKYQNNFLSAKTNFELPSLEKIGFRNKNYNFPNRKINNEIISNYHLTRDIPSVEGTSRLGIHLRFGTISIRQVFREASSLNNTFINELIWREFYAMIMWHFPQVVYASYKIRYDNIKWVNNEKDFKAWKNGKTGYPLVDAGMRQLSETGFMHNRLRMLCASFLCKHLLIDWRWGEAYFAEKLLDYELSSNNGGWQWCAGSGSDAAPYFRIFSPERQRIKFDPENIFIKKWVTEYNTTEYPKPIIEHNFAVERCKKIYKQALS
jgi:deoxyribodipyrimidine photo-lyase